MNERIKELAEQAKDHADYYAMLSDGIEQEIFTTKFAELIVRKCISINKQRMFSEYEGDTHRVAHNNALLCANSDMFEHFGVED